MNVRIHFDLITEPWIPVVNGDDTISYLGIWDALQTASKSKGISDASPLVEFGLYRLLSVFLMDALRPEDQFELEDLENAGQFDMAKIQNYIEQCQAEGASFDLFDPERPFLQSPYDKAWDKEKKPVTYLDCRVPTGNNHVHFDHLQESRVFSYAEAARYLPVLPLFVTAGAQGYPSTINAAPPYFTVIKGSNLFETLVHLLLPVDEIDDFDSVPVYWRCNKPVVPKKQVAHTSWLYGMLFPARRVLLIPESDGVREIYYSQGENFCEPGNWTDPHVTYRFGKTGRFPWRPNGAKAVWRNLSDLINIEDQHAPKIMALYRRLHEGSLEDVHVCLYGVQTSNASFLDLAYHDMQIPASLLQAGKALLVEQCILGAEKMAKNMAGALSCHGISAATLQESVQSFYQRCETKLWAFCRSELTMEAVEEDTAQARWDLVLYELGKEIVEQTLNRLSLTGQAWLEVYQHQAGWARYLSTLRKRGDETHGGSD